MICLLCTGCSSPQVPGDIPESLPQPENEPVENSKDRAALRGLNWLAARQNMDGTWGAADNRVALTGLATWAFLMRGETPASDAYGKTVENGLIFLVKKEENHIPRSPEETALLVGCLADAYSLTRIPAVLVRVQKVAPLLLVAGETSVWHPRVAISLYPLLVDKMKWGLTELRLIRSNLAEGEDDLLSQANLLLLSGFPEDPAEMGGTIRDNIHHLSPAKWRENRRPLVAAFVLSQGIFLAGDSADWKAWNRSFDRDVVSRQLVNGTQGWWTPAALGLPATPEIEGLSEDESAIYTTALLLMAFPPEPRLPTFGDKPLAPPLPPVEMKDPGDIDIKL